MPRLVIPLFIAFLLLAIPVSAVYYVRSPSFLYEVQYSVLSNGSEALIPLSVLQYGITCSMDSCWAEVYGDQEYILLFNGSQLYLLNFTPALKTSLPSYIPKNITDIYFNNGIAYVNSSWYITITYYVDMGKFEISKSFNDVYRLDTKNFCAERVNVSLSRFGKTAFKKEINGWEIEIPRKFWPLWTSKQNKTKNPPLEADFRVAVNASVASNWSSVPVLIVNSTSFPVYFLLRNGSLTRNVTLLYLNTTPVWIYCGYYNENTTELPGYWFPNDVKIIKVTLCKKATNTPNKTMSQTTVRGNTTASIEKIATTTSTTTKEKSICGPGLVVLTTLLPLLLRRHRN
ncbi:CGP-CTERM sorting domain-containing protein [Thermococcus sp.]|uniref:CGP-CTERM sorting domain-containing protein n=1 Tax=Thermococcus sp. TaxID=35749 RepID=UPI0026206860|nr:CGP-CTERM sorting domain-containing protein [Thermococcus sp.]